MTYWIKDGMKDKVKNGKTLKQVANEIGLEWHYLTNILNRKQPVKHKAMAYAITKYAGSEYEIADLFDIETL